MAITWRNINSNSAAAASVAGQLMNSAQQSFESGLEGLKNNLRAREERDASNWDVTKQNNTEAFLNKLNSYKTPEELAAAQASGELDVLRSQYGAQVDGNAIRGAESEMQQKLIERITAQNQYEDDTTTRAQSGDVDAIKSLIAQRNFDAAGTQLGQLELKNEAPLYQALQEAQRQQVVEGQDDQRFGMEKGRYGADMLNSSLLSRQRQLQLDQADKAAQVESLVARVTETAGSEAEARTAFLDIARSQKLGTSAIIDGISKVGSLYNSAVDLTQEEKANIEKVTASKKIELDRFMEDQKTNLDKIVKNSPVDKVFSFSDKNRMTEGQVFKQIADATPKNRDPIFGKDPLVKAKSSLDSAVTKYKPPKGMELGPVLQEALLRTGTIGIDGELLSWDADLDEVLFKKNLDEVMGQAIKSFNNQTIVDEAQAEYRNKVREQEDRIIGEVSSLTSTLKNTKKLKKELNQR